MGGSRPSKDLTTQGHRSVPRPQPDPATGLIHLSRLVQGIHAEVADRHDLPPVQAKLLCVLALGDCQMAQLARSFGVEKAALTGLVDRAEQRGLVRRTAVPGDRRAVAVTLTEEGRRAAGAFHGDATQTLDSLLTPLPETDRAAFGRLMWKVIDAAGMIPLAEGA